MTHVVDFYFTTKAEAEISLSDGVDDDSREFESESTDVDAKLIYSNISEC